MTGEEDVQSSSSANPLARALLESYPGRAILLDADGAITAVNQQWADVAEGATSPLLSAEVGWNYRTIAARNGAEAFRTTVEALDAVLKGTSSERRFEFSVAQGDLRHRLLGRVVGLDRESRCVLVAHHELRSFEQVNRQREELEQALHRAEETRDEVLSLVSHELRTPLTGVKGNAEVLVRRGEQLPRPLRLQALRDIERDAERLREVVENMLILAHRESDSVASEPVLLQRVIPQAVHEHLVRHPASSVDLDLDEDLPPVLGDKEHLRQILTNLLSNAAKYSAPQSPLLLRAREEDDSVQAEIVDEGIGIPPEELDSIWEPFVRGSNAAGGYGMGLGLPVVKTLAQRHGAEVALLNRTDGPGAIAALRLHSALPAE